MRTRTDGRIDSESTFMSGVLVLTVSTVIVKIIGLAYKIPLMSILGAEGMGYFNTAYEIFALLCGVSTSGLPIAVSMLIATAKEAGDSRRIRGIYKTSTAILLTKGVLFSGVLAVFAEPIARAVGNPQAYFAILAISPALLFCCATGAVRGYFQGFRKMVPTAISQLIEAVGKLLLGVGFSALARGAGMSLAVCAAFGVLGVSVGGFVSAVWIFIKQRAFTRTVLPNPKKLAVRKGGYFFSLFRISLPITVCSALIGATRIIDMTFLLRGLSNIGVGVADANKIYGAYTTLALPVAGLVPAFIPPVTESLIPRLSAAVESGSREEQQSAVRGAMRLTFFFAVPATLGIIFFAEPILGLLFPNEAQSIAICAPLLSALGASVLFSCITSTANAVLQSYRRVFLPIISLGVGVVLKAVLAYILIGNPEIAQMGAPLSTLASAGAVLILDAVFVCRTVKGKTGLFSELLRPLLCAGISTAVCFALYRALMGAEVGRTPSFLLAFSLDVAIYFLLSVGMGVVKKDDIPKKNKIYT